MIGLIRCVLKLSSLFFYKSTYPGRLMLLRHFWRVCLWGESFQRGLQLSTGSFMTGIVRRWAGNDHPAKDKPGPDRSSVEAAAVQVSGNDKWRNSGAANSNFPASPGDPALYPPPLLWRGGFFCRGRGCYVKQRGSMRGFVTVCNQIFPAIHSLWRKNREVTKILIIEK